LHDGQKTCDGLPQYYQESDMVLRRLGVRPPHLKNFVRDVARHMLSGWRAACAWAAAYGLMKALPPPVVLSDDIKKRNAKKCA
jgi:hypothetical protein